jgi:hypothetical protein
MDGMKYGSKKIERGKSQGYRKTNGKEYNGKMTALLCEIIGG